MSLFGSSKKESTPQSLDGGWEYLEDDNDFETYRRKVPGGWLVRTIEALYHGGGDALTFVPDPNHEWRV